MTKCLFKALKAVDLDKHVGLFRSLGYDSAGALAHFRAEHFEKLNFNEQELLHLISLLDVIKEAAHEGKICPHYFNSTKTNKQQSPIKSAPAVRASWSDETVQQRNCQSTIRKQSNDNYRSKRSKSSIEVTRRLSSTTKTVKNHSDEFIFQKSSTILSREHPLTPTKNINQKVSGPKSFLNRPAVQHVKVKSYNYGVPTTRRSRPISHRANYQHESIFFSSSHHTNDMISYAKPAEIYVYARKRPLLSNETNLEDTITVPDNKRIIITENKANLDCTPLLKKTEFQFDQVFGSDVSNKQIFESTVLPFISTDHRHNLTYICFGQTGSGKSHTMFGSRTTDGLLIYCTQLLLQEINVDNKLICSFYEIYNNQVYDLVNAGKRLFVREDGEHHVNVIGVTEVLLRNLDNLRCVIDAGLTRRHHGKSAFNSNSSRSHAVFQITLKNNNDSAENFRLIFIDLAGSERATDAQNNLRQTRREGAQINWSLLALKECIRSMDMTHSHAPFRQSKLTHILRDSLVGSKARTCLMANVSPPEDCCQCSLNTLQYASRIRDISMRHRHRSMPMTTTILPTNYTDDTIKEQEIPQRTFKPATSSTPVHRLISSIDQRIYMSTNQTDADARITKPLDIDWQIADDDDDIPISGGGDNHPLKLSKHEFNINSNTNNHHVNRLHQKKTNTINESPSSYFPLPQSDIKKSSSNKTRRSYDSSRLMYDDGNERKWKAVPSPINHRHANSSIDPPNSTRIIPVAPIQISDDNLFSSATGTESLGTKITKAAANDQRHNRSSTHNGLIESLNLNKQYDIGTLTTDTEPMLYSDRQATYRDQTGFFTNRDELLSIVSSRLTTVSQRSLSVATPKKTKMNSQSSVSNSSRISFSSPNKTRHKTRPIKSTSSITSLASDSQVKKSSLDNKKTKLTSSIDFQKFDPTIRHSSNRHHHQRTVPLRVHHSSDSEDDKKTHHNTHRRKPYSSKTTSYSTRSEGCQTTNDIHLMKNEQEQIDDYLPREQVHEQKNIEPSSLLFTPISTTLPATSSSPTLLPSSLIQAPLDQVKVLFDQPVSPVPSANINNPWPISTSFSSPSKDFSIRVSDQLNALRTLLETHLVEPNETKRQTKDFSILQSSPGTFARQFLQSCRQSSSLKNNSTELLSDIDDDDKEVARSFNNKNNSSSKALQYGAHVFSSSTNSSNQFGYSSKRFYEQIIHPSLSSFSDELHQAKVSSSVGLPSTSTITSNLAAKIDTQEPQNFSSQDDGILCHQSSNENHVEVNDNKGIGGNASIPTSDSERTSQVNSRLQNPFTRTSSDGSSLNGSPSRSPILKPAFNTLDTASRTNNGHSHLLDSSKSSTFLTGSPFDALLNSLKTMREKDLDFVVHNSDDKLIPVAD